METFGGVLVPWVLLDVGGELLCRLGDLINHFLLVFGFREDVGFSRSAQYPSGNQTHSCPSLGGRGGSAAWRGLELERVSRCTFSFQSETLGWNSLPRDKEDAAELEIASLLLLLDLSVMCVASKRGETGSDSSGCELLLVLRRRMKTKGSGSKELRGLGGSALDSRRLFEAIAVIHLQNT